MFEFILLLLIVKKALFLTVKSKSYEFNEPLGSITPPALIIKSPEKVWDEPFSLNSPLPSLVKFPLPAKIPE